MDKWSWLRLCIIMFGVVWLKQIYIRVKYHICSEGDARDFTGEQV